MTVPRTYPHGVPSWVDTEQPDPDAARRFYAELFGWTLTEAMPPGAPGIHQRQAGAPAGFAVSQFTPPSDF
jgi:predicted enzyme related to lactoylglutathione lyase